MLQAVNNNDANNNAIGIGGAPRKIETVYAKDENLLKAYNFQTFKERMTTTRVMHIQTGQNLLRDSKTVRVNDLIAEFHMQYLYVLQTTILPEGYKVDDYNRAIFNVHEAPHPFNSFKRWIVLPVLSRHGGIFPHGTMAEGINMDQAAGNWLAACNY